MPFSLSTNNIDKISNLAGLDNLKVLSLGRNLIKRIEGLDPVADTLEAREAAADPPAPTPAAARAGSRYRERAVAPHTAVPPATTGALAQLQPGGAADRP